MIEHAIVNDDYDNRSREWEQMQPPIPKAIKAKLGATALDLKNYLKQNEIYQEEEKANVEYRKTIERIERIDTARQKYPDYYHDWQIDCLEMIKDKDNVILSSPTGSGKTTVFLDWAERKRKESERESKGHHTVYITAPTKALSNQRFEELQKAGYSVGLETGDIKKIPENEDGTNNVDYICCTQEIYTNKYAEDENATLVIDEFHYIFENPDRARNYVDGLHESKAKNSLICSATFGDMSKTVDYIQKVSGKRQFGYENHDRLTEIDIRDEIGAENIHDALIVSFSARNCKEVAKTMYSLRKEGYITEYVGDSEEYEGRDGDILDRYVEYERNIEVDTDYEYDENRAKEIEELARALDIKNQSLIDWAKYGISTYYSDMLPKEKSFVEQAFANRLIDVVASTDAVALGVNFPIEMVVFGQLAKYKDGPISKNLFDQLAGRAGRLGYFDEGEVYFCNDFYWSDRNGNHHSIEGRDYDTGELFEQLRLAPNESLSITLTPDYRAIFRGEKTIEEETEFLRKYSTDNEHVSESDLAEMCESITGDAMDLVFQDIAIQAIASIEDEDDYWDYEIDYEGREIICGQRDRRGDFTAYQRYNVEEIEAYKEIEATYLYENFGVTSVEEFNERFKETISKCYNPELSILDNRRFALLVMSGNSEEFDEKTKNSKSLRDLLSLHSYLFSLPQEYRSEFVDSIYKIEMRVDEMDDSVLNDGRGRIKLSELSDLFVQNVKDDADLKTIEKKLNKGEEHLSKKEVELLFEAERAIGIVDIYDEEQYSEFVQSLRNQISLRDVIDSGADLTKILKNGQSSISDWLRMQEWTSEDGKYCLSFLLDNNLFNEVINNAGHHLLLKIPIEVIYDNFQSIQEQGVSMEEIVQIEGQHFTKSSQIELFKDVPFDELTRYKYRIFDSMDVLKKVNEQYNVSFDDMIKKKLVSKKLVRRNLEQLIEEFNVPPASLIDYCVDFSTDGQGWSHRKIYTPHDESIRELVELGASPKDIVKYFTDRNYRREWITEYLQDLIGHELVDGDSQFNEREEK